VGDGRDRLPVEVGDQPVEGVEDALAGRQEALAALGFGGRGGVAYLAQRELGVALE